MMNGVRKLWSLARQRAAALAQRVMGRDPAPRFAIQPDPFAGWSSWIDSFRPLPLLVAAVFAFPILIPPAILALPTLDEPAQVTGRLVTVPPPADDAAASPPAVLAGDAFRLVDANEHERIVRLHGVTARRACGGDDEAADPCDALASLLDGEEISCERRSADPYRRYVATCQLSGGDDVAARLVARGMLKDDCLITGGVHGACAPAPKALGFVTSRFVRLGNGALGVVHWGLSGVDGGWSRAFWRRAGGVFIYTPPEAETANDDATGNDT